MVLKPNAESCKEISLDRALSAEPGRATTCILGTLVLPGAVLCARARSPVLLWLRSDLPPLPSRAPSKATSQSFSNNSQIWHTLAALTDVEEVRMLVCLALSLPSLPLPPAISFSSMCLEKNHRIQRTMSS